MNKNKYCSQLINKCIKNLISLNGKNDKNIISNKLKESIDMINFALIYVNDIEDSVEIKDK